MGRLLTLVAAVPPLEPVQLLPGYVLRAATSSDIPALGALYFESYDPGQASADVAAATADIAAAFRGEYGKLWLAASPVAVALDGSLAGAIQVVHRAPWPDTPECPFVIELFTGRAHRGRGLARALMLSAMAVVDQGRIGLRVTEDNEPARALYKSLGFREYAA